VFYVVFHLIMYFGCCFKSVFWSPTSFFYTWLKLLHFFMSVYIIHSFQYFAIIDNDVIDIHV
jgi:hypothetical protein